jgi:hypothetical protein
LEWPLDNKALLPSVKINGKVGQHFLNLNINRALRDPKPYPLP